ncbi:MAG: conjugal transfer protein TrbI, partial [Candidatus Omnitrophica bacterium]|nr:conjugal transfer protein TrbI [Candidatus Omnitrophota bacterium]
TKADPKASTHQDPLTDSLHEIINMAKSSSPDEKLSALGEAGAQLVNNINNQEGKQSFLKNIDTGGDYLESSLQKPRSRYEIKAGSYIPAALITGINSDLPGNVSAQVTENVFDTITGNYLLIPQGARLVGEYNSNLSFGQMRVQVVWKRIIFPDGKSLDLKKMQGADISGYTGFHDQINNHYFRIYGSAVLLSFMGAGYDILNQDNRQNQTYESPRSIVAANVGQKLSDVSSQALEKNMDVQPTIIINPGYKFNIMVIKDMVLENIKDAQGALGYSE